MVHVVRRRWSTLLLPLFAAAALVAAFVPGVASAANTGQITGTISDAGGAVSGASVEAFLANDVRAGAVNTAVDTAANGSYTITGLATGSYVVEAVPPSGSSDVATYSPNVGDAYTATPVAVTNGATASGANITLSAGGTVSGTIKTPSGSTVAGVQVSVEDASGRPVGSGGKTAADGTYSIPGVAPGTYYVFVDASQTDFTNSTNYTSEWFGAPNPGSESALSEANAAAITVTSGASTSVNQTLGAGGAITGTVTDASGDLASFVYAYDTAGNFAGSGLSSATTGTYTVYGLPAGTYVLEFVPFTNAAGSQVDANDAYYGGTAAAESLETAAPVGVTAGQTATANFVAPAGGSIAGKVTANGQPVAGIPIELYDSAGNLINDSAATSAANGNYAIQGLVPGNYKVEFGPTNTLNADAPNLGFQYYNNVSTLAGANAVAVTNGQTTSSINGSLGTGGQITGTVVAGAAKAGLANVTVDLLDASGNVLESTYTLGNGTYTLTGVPTGAYFVEFVPPTGLASQYQVQYYGGTQVQAGSTAVSVTAPATTPNVNGALVAATTAGAVTPVAVPFALTLTATVPTVSGTAKVGDKLTAKTSGWTAGTSFSYQWYATGKAIKGATASTFTLVGADVKKVITVAVTGKQSGYLWTTETSAKTKAVAAGTLKTVVPKITGTAKVGDKLTAKTGTWTKGTKFAYQWYANKKAIKGATKGTFKLAKGEAAKAVTVKVTGKLTGYTSVAKTSKATKKVAA